MKKGRELISLPVIEHNTGNGLGEIKDVYYDPIAKKVIGLIIEEGGWFKGAKIIPVEEIIKINDDAVYIKNLDVIIDSKVDRELCENFDQRLDIRGNKLINETGEEVGIIRDLLINTETGEICGFEISDGVIKDLLEGRKSILTSGNISLHDEEVIIS